LITIILCSCKSEMFSWKGDLCTKNKSGDPGQNEDLCADYQVFCSCKSCL